MEMIRHQAVGEARQFVPHDDAFEASKEIDPVGIASEDRLAITST
jgi:DNA polymerase IIIc chi subunit